MVTGWMYDHKYLSDDFNYEDLETKYVESALKEAGSVGAHSQLREQLDEAHRA
jgi:hypothetical protein